MSWLKALLRWGSRAKLVGTDLTGNQYFEKAVTRDPKPRRSVKLKESSPLEDYSPDSIPPEWDRWLRGLQQHPPSVEEMSARVQQAQVLQRKVFEVEQKDKKLREKEIADGLVAAGPQRTKTTGHASAPSYRSEDTSDEPTRTGTDFKPAEWQPAPPTK